MSFILKRLCAIITACSIIIGISTVPIYAQEGEFIAECAVENGMYSISGKGNSDYINVIVMPADESDDNLTAQKLSQLDYISFSVKNNGNSFEKSFTMPEGFPDGEYKSVIWDGSQKLEVYFMIGSETYKNELIREKIQNNMLDEIIKRYGYQYKIDVKEYETLKQGVKSAVCKELAQDKITDFPAQYKESVLKASFEQIETAEEVYSVLVMLNTDFTDYNRLNKQEQSAVLMKLLKNIPDTQAALKSLAEQYSQEARKKQDAGQTTGGSSGGGKVLGPSAGSMISTIADGKQEPISSAKPAQTQRLSDISEHWARDSITELLDLGIVSGREDGNFYPEDNITRAEFSKILAGIMNLEINTASSQKFSDVEPLVWYYECISALCENGIMEGYTDNTFRPDNNITRQEMAAAIYRVLKKEEIAMDAEGEFSDMAEVNEYARTAVLRLGGLEIISGYEGKFRPADKLTRAEAATVMLRVYKIFDNTDTDYASDNSTKDNREDDKNNRSLLVKTEMTKQEARIAEAEQLIPKLLGRPMRGVTRAGFISDVYDLSNKIQMTASQQYFTDLPLSREEAASVQSAVDMGFAEKAETFNPDDVISGYDAVRAVVCALGYKEYTDLSGGGQAEYMQTANNADLLYNISSGVLSEALDERYAKLLLLNMLQSRFVTISGSSGNIAKLSASSETLLEKVYGLYVSTGIVNETNLNSLTRTGISRQRNIIIGNENYIADENDDYMPYLGYHVNAYHTEDNELFMLVLTEKNKTASFPTDGTVMKDNLTVLYEGENDKRSYKHKLSNDYYFLYNGALSERTPEQVLNEALEGSVEMIDNDGNGQYDIIIINRPEYVVVDSISKINKLIYDKNSSESAVSMLDDEAVFRIEGRNGNIRFLDISPDETYEIYATEDKKLVSLKLMTAAIAGKASSRSDNKITVNETEYKTTEYFNKYYSDTMQLGKDYSFVISDEGRIIGFTQPASDMKLGYVTFAGWDDGKENESLWVRLFTQNNKFETYITDSKLRVDGKKVKVSELYDRLSYDGAISDQLVCYKADADGKITDIDFAEVTGECEPGKKKNERNSLTEYKFNESSFLYRSTGQLMYPRFNISGSVVFLVPKDIKDTDDFRVTNSSFFLDNTSYNGMKVYNLSESGSAEAIVLRLDGSKPNFLPTNGSLVIEDVVWACNEDDEVVQQISGWVDTQYKTYYLDSSISTYKASGEELGFGDVIRFDADGDTIKALVCDFDAHPSVFARNNDANASEMNGGYKSFMYQFGEAYYADSSHIYIGGGDDGRDLSTLSLRNFSSNTANIAIIDMKEKTIRTGKISDIKTYKKFGEGDIVLIRQRALLTMAIYVYVR